MEKTEHPPLHFLKMLDSEMEQPRRNDSCRGGPSIREAVLLLDYDGTLSPIVSNPQDAHLPSGKKTLLSDLARKFPVFIISGRETGDVKARVGIEGVGYAGSHGFEIDLGTEVFHPFNNTEYLSKLDSIYNDISEELSNVKGCIIEHKKWSLSIHYRCCDTEAAEKVKETVYRLVNDRKYSDYVKQTFGKMVLEVRVLFDWHKGKAVEFIRNRLVREEKQQRSRSKTTEDETEPLPILLYIGDDTTDEDAFEMVNQFNGYSILVVSSEKDDRVTTGNNTHAKYYLIGTEEVYSALEKISKLASA